MYFSTRNISGLILSENEGFFSIGYFGSAFNNNPVLCTMMVFLKTQARFRLNFYAFNLETLTFINAVIPTPGAVHFTMLRTLRALGTVQHLHNAFNILTARSISNQYSIWCFYHNHIFDTDHAYQTTGCMHERVTTVFQQNITVMRV